MGVLHFFITHLFSSGRESLPPGARVVSDLSPHATSPFYSEIPSRASGPTGLGFPWPHNAVPNVCNYLLLQQRSKKILVQDHDPMFQFFFFIGRVIVQNMTPTPKQNSLG